MKFTQNIKNIVFRNLKDGPMEDNKNRNLLILIAILVVGGVLVAKTLNSAKEPSVPAVATPTEATPMPSATPTPTATPEATATPQAAAEASPTPVLVMQPPVIGTPAPASTPKELMQQMEASAKRREAALASESGAMAAMPELESCLTKPFATPEPPPAVKAQLTPEMRRQFENIPKAAKQECTTMLKKIGEKFPNLKAKTDDIIARGKN
jgi:hypothetical protein